VLADDWNQDPAGRYNALLNSIAVDDSESMTRVLREGKLDPNLPIDVRRVRAISAPNYVVVCQVDEAATWAGDGTTPCSGQYQALFARGHDLRCPLLPTPLVIAALSRAGKCLAVLIREFSARIGPEGTGVTLEHLLESLIEPCHQTYAVKIAKVGEEMPEHITHRWPRCPKIKGSRASCQSVDVLGLVAEVCPPSP
jgi:hypothetical protein